MTGSLPCIAEIIRALYINDTSIKKEAFQGEKECKIIKLNQVSYVCHHIKSLKHLGKEYEAGKHQTQLASRKTAI